jgi:molybdate transport system regulatory protein
MSATRKSVEGKAVVGKHTMTLDGTVWLTIDGALLGGRHRIGLLRAVHETGSITQAAKAIGLSYKAAWDAVDAMNNLAGAALVERSAGGRGGGRTALTARGLQLVERYDAIDAMHRRFVEQLGAGSVDLAKDIDLLRTLNMKTSARNHFVGTVVALRKGAVNDEVELAIGGGHRLVAVVTRESSESLGLVEGATAFALVKASSIIVATDLASAKLSARNQLTGTVTHVEHGAVNDEIVMTLSGNEDAATDAALTVAAIVTSASAKALGLVPGVTATALFKASSVIVGVPG